MLKEGEAPSVLDDPPGSGIFEVLSMVVNSIWRSLKVALSDPLVSDAMTRLAGFVLLVILLYLLILWYQRRRRRRKGMWMSDQERWLHVHRAISDASVEAIEREIADGYITRKQANDFYNRLGKALKTNELQTRRKNRSPLTPGFQRRLVWKIRNKIKNGYYAVKANIPGAPPPVIEIKPKKKPRNKLEAAWNG